MIEATSGLDCAQLGMLIEGSLRLDTIGKHIEYGLHTFTMHIEIGLPAHSTCATKLTRAQFVCTSDHSARPMIESSHKLWPSLKAIEPRRRGRPYRPSHIPLGKDLKRIFCPNRNMLAGFRCTKGFHQQSAPLIRTGTLATPQAITWYGSSA